MLFRSYFHDCDGTNTSPSDRHKNMYNSMQERGFQLFGLKSGVPMIPNPKSEAWLLCALKENPYQNCDNLESTPGNDDSPNSLKKQLERCVHSRNIDCSNGLQQALNDLIRPIDETKQIDFLRIDMPSFNLFLDDLKQAIRFTDTNWKEEYDSRLEECVNIAKNYLGA